MLGIAVDEIEAHYDGLAVDRFAMLVDHKNRFLSQKAYPQLSKFSLSIENEIIVVKYENEKLIIHPNAWTSKQIITNMWEDKVTCNEASIEINEWFSKRLEFEVRLLKKVAKNSRVRDYYTYLNTPVSLTNSHPYHLLSIASLDLLNEKIGQKLKINRFRPNFVISGIEPNGEDNIDTIQIGNVVFKNVSRCFRCAVTSVDQETNKRTKEPLKTLNTYRNFDGEIFFGIQLICLNEGTINIHNEIKIKYK